jgi:hypothetical protein
VLPPDAERDAIIAKTKAILWARGELDFKRHATQQSMHNTWKKSRGSVFMHLCSRRLGKSVELCLSALEKGIQKPHARILYLAPHGTDAVRIATDIMAQLLSDCPEHLKPAFSKGDAEYTFPSNGSVIRFHGVNDGRAAYIRGVSADLVLVDEAGTMQDFKSVLNDVILPTTLTTDGKIIVATTPAASPSHYSTELYERLARKGSVANFTLLDAVHLTPEAKFRALEEHGEAEEDIPEILAGRMEPKTTSAQREYFCSFVTDSATAVFPEFNKKAQAEIVLKDYPVAPHRDLYVALDVGSVDKTAILFAWYDFINGKIVIEDEALLTNPSTKDIADIIKKKEALLWGVHGYIPEPYMRVSDIDLRLIQDLRSLYGLQIQAVRNKDVLADINFTRHAIRERQLVIHPRCVNLIRQTQNAIWSSSGKDFARSKEKDSLDIHYDLCAALKYLVKSVQWGRNPYPEGFHRPAALHHIAYTIRKHGEDKNFLKRDTPLGRRLNGQKIYADPYKKKPTKR